MISLDFKLFRIQNAKDFKIHLAFLWTLFLSFGFFSGVFTACSLGDNGFNLDSGYVCFAAFLNLFAIVISALINRYRKRFILWFASVRALCSGVVLGICAGCFGYAGWFVNFLLNFSGMFTSVAEIWLWSTDVTKQSRFEYIGFSLFLLGMVLITVILELFFLISFASALFINFK